MAAEAAPTGTTMPERPAPAQLTTSPPPAAAAPAARQSQFQPLQLPAPEPFKPSRPFSLGKLILACCNAVVALITLALSIALVVEFLGFDSALGGVILAVAAVVSVFWQAAEFITLLVRRSIRRPIHPGAHVGMHLVLWILALLAMLSLAFSLSWTLSDWSVDPSCGDGDYAYYAEDGSWTYCGYDTFTTSAQAHSYFAMLEATVAFGVLLTVGHFVLFVIACVETDRRRRFGKRTKVVYLVANPDAPADGRMYYAQVAPPQAPAAAKVAPPSSGSEV